MRPSSASRIGLLALLLAACQPAAATPTPIAQRKAPPVTQAEPTSAPPAPPTAGPTEDLSAFPLSEPGPFQVGIRRNVTFIDTSRDGREVALTLWYPALPPPDSQAPGLNADAVPDPAGAPYPLILSSSKLGFSFGPHLASHGLVVAGINGIDTYIPWDQNLLDQPLDILFALDRIAETKLEGLEGLIDAEHAGTMGYSFDGYNALAVSGVRVDPEFLVTECGKTPLKEHWVKFGYCSVAADWDQFAAHAGTSITTSDDGLWQPMTDARIRAVMPMAPDGAALFGEQGLAAADRAMLILAPTDDYGSYYEEEAVHIYEQSGTLDKSLISFVGKNHFMIFDPAMVARMRHFAVAFFGHRLQGREELQSMYSEGFVAEQEGLAWGPYRAR